ncbi:MAG: hypothetical protein K0Q79_3317 [Flavipsychrobacter sp.]|jgi:hypothetical protein|nr:hypothetical protein [Flavipsychrobacter sp.]
MSPNPKTGDLARTKMETPSNKEQSHHVPVIIGNYAPFRLVLRETDSWMPTLEQINSREYDYVKLCRLSGFIDIGIAPFSLGISFDGSLVLPASPNFKTRESAFNKFNETLGILLLGGIYSEAVQPTDISFGTLFFDGYVKQHNGGTGHEASFHKAIQTKYVSTIDVISLLNPKTINFTELKDAYKKGKEYFSKLDKLSPSLLLNGTSNYVKHQWGEGLIFLWTSIEQVVNIIWTNEIIKNDIDGEEIVDGRSKFLKDFRTWTTSAKIELLYQKEFIRTEQYKLLNKARKSRNDFVHNGKELTQENVQCALNGLFSLLSLVISSYQNSDLLNDTLETIYRNQRGDLIPKKTTFDKEEVTHWLSLPPLPGDNGWGNKEYEIIDDLVLKPLK